MILPVMYAHLMRSIDGSGLLGEAATGSQAVAQNVPLLRLRLISGREQMAAQQMGIEAQYAVDLYADPSWPKLERCWLEFVGSDRKLNVVYVDDTRPPLVTLFCGEAR